MSDLLRPSSAWLRKVFSGTGGNDNDTELAQLPPALRYDIPPHSESSSVASTPSGGGISIFVRILRCERSHETRFGSIARQTRQFIQPSDYIKDSYRVMGWFGISRFEIFDDNGGLNGCIRMGSWLQQGMFLLVTTLSTFQSLCLTKGCFFSYMNTSSYSDFILFVYTLSYLVVKAYSSFVFGSTKFLNKKREMFDAICSYENSTKLAVSTKGVWWKGKVVVTIGIITLLLSGLHSVFFTKFVNVDAFKAVFTSSCANLDADLFTWSFPESFEPDNDTSTTATTATSLPHNMTNIAYSDLLCGTIVIGRNIASHLHVGLVLTFLCTLTIAFNQLTAPFMEKLKPIMAKQVDDVEQRNALQAEREAVWKEFQMLKRVSKTVNDVNDTLVKMMHIANLLSFTLIMSQFALEKTLKGFHMVVSFIDLAKADLTYYMAGRIAEKNEKVRAWIRNWGWSTGKITVNGSEIDAHMALDEQEKEPIGLGKGSFLIRHTFHYKFLGIVGSTFFSMADEVNKNCI